MIGVGGIPQAPELRRRLLFTFAMLAVYRIGVHIPTPGINTKALADFFSQTQGTLFGLIDLFAGGAFRNLSIFALGIMPYISVAIIMELLAVAVPHLERLRREGEAGRRQIVRYTRYGTVLLGLFQGLGIAIGLERMVSPGGIPIVPEPGWGFRLHTMLTLATGTTLLMWIGEQISEFGIGNGISLIIFAGIVSSMPGAAIKVLGLLGAGEMNLLEVLLLVAFMVAVVGFIVFVERGQRRIPVQYAKRVVGRRVYGGQTTHLPLKVNTAGVIPPIFASSLLMFPYTVASFLPPGFPEAHPWFAQLMHQLSPGNLLYTVLYVGLIIFFCYFYTAIVFNTQEVADNLRRYGGYIPGVRPGRRTAEYIDRVLTRITFGGALYVSAICVLPSLLTREFAVPFYFGGTALLIVVGVALDTLGAIEAHLVVRQYEGLMRRARMRR